MAAPPCVSHPFWQFLPRETFPDLSGSREIFDPGLRLSLSTMSEARTICNLDPSEWVNKVTQSAQASLHASTNFKDPRGEPRPVDPMRARSIFNDVIAISASKLQEASDTQHEILQDATVGIWISYADMEKRLRQFQQASAVYTRAAEIDEVRTCDMFWHAYLTYLEERGKPQKTREALLCALQCLMPCPDSDRICGKFCDSGRPVMGAG